MLDGRQVVGMLTTTTGTVWTAGHDGLFEKYITTDRCGNEVWVLDHGVWGWEVIVGWPTISPWDGTSTMVDTFGDVMEVLRPQV